MLSKVCFLFLVDWLSEWMWREGKKEERNWTTFTICIISLYIWSRFFFLMFIARTYHWRQSVSTLKDMYYKILRLQKCFRFVVVMVYSQLHIEPLFIEFHLTCHQINWCPPSPAKDTECLGVSRCISSIISKHVCSSPLPQGIECWFTRSQLSIFQKLFIQIILITFSI